MLTESRLPRAAARLVLVSRRFTGVAAVHAGAVLPCAQLECASTAALLRVPGVNASMPSVNVAVFAPDAMPPSVAAERSHDQLPGQPAGGVTWPRLAVAGIATEQVAPPLAVSVSETTPGLPAALPTLVTVTVYVSSLLIGADPDGATMSETTNVAFEGATAGTA